MEIARGLVKRKTDIFQTFVTHLGAGLVGTSGNQYSDLSPTIGVAEVEVLNEKIDPGINMGLSEIEVGLTQRFTELIGGTTNASLSYVWEAREEWKDFGGRVPTIRTGDWIGITATYEKSVASQATSEDTLSGYIPVATLSHAPIRLRMLAKAKVAASMQGQVKNTSYVRLVGTVIPGA